jgi:CheY-like chemotaxis protein
MKVLLVDDDPDQLYVRSVLLEKNGFGVVAASNRSTALEVAQAEQLSCALVDLSLPSEQDGLALIRDLKAQSPALPIVLLTGKRARLLARLPEMRLVNQIVEKGSASHDLLRKLREIRDGQTPH